MESHYAELHKTLKAWQPIWADSILQNWPSSHAHFPKAWLSCLQNLSHEDLRSFANGEVLPVLPEDLRSLTRDLKAFEYPEVRNKASLDEQECQGLNRKKQHEIESLLPLLEEQRACVTQAVDIGGGIGHLARICVKRFGWTFHSIDRDLALQEKGRWWLKRSRDLDRSRLIFVAAEFRQEPQDLDQLFTAPETLSLGLHTCGSLAVAQLRKSLESRRVINFGCCFDKTRAQDLNLSQLAQSDPIPWNPSSLFLATRGRGELSDAEFRLLRRVNDYRFALDRLFRQRFPEQGFLIAGDAPKALYLGDFAYYANDRLPRLGLGAMSAPELESFYAEVQTQDEIFAIFSAHLIRSLFARPLEILLILDRALWLREQGFATEVRAVFDRKLSPRNLALIGRL